MVILPLATGDKSFEPKVVRLLALSESPENTGLILSRSSRLATMNSQDKECLLWSLPLPLLKQSGPLLQRGQLPLLNGTTGRDEVGMSKR